MSSDVIIVGGGIIGACSAYYLSRAGARVRIVERSTFGSACSSANCGLVCPSHVLPLTTPGAIGRAVRSLFQKDAAFAVKFRLDPSLWGWLLSFARRCNPTDMLAAGRGIQALLNSSRQLYEQLITAERLDCDWETQGLLFVFASEAGLEHYAETNRLISDNFGMPAKAFIGQELQDLEPALKPGLAGGFLYERDAHLRPERLLAELRRILEARGVQIVEHCAVEQVKQSAGRATALVTHQGELTADTYLFATGAWTPLFNRELGCRVPIQPGKGYSLTMPRPECCPQLPLIFEEHHVAVTPWASGYRLGSTMEFSGYDTHLNPRRLELLKQGASHYLHEPHCEPVLETWYGWRPMTPDSKPVIDRSPRHDNVWLAAGHNMLGLSMAPATGKLLTELLSGQSPHVDPGAYRLARFES